MQIRRHLIAILLLALGLTGVLLVALSGTAGSTPKGDTTTVIAPSVGGDNGLSEGDAMGYDTVDPGAAAYVVVPRGAGGR